MKKNNLRIIRILARLLDSKFSIFGIKFGIDPVIGLIPGLGEIVTIIMGIYIVVLAKQMGLPHALISKMWTNLLLDFLVGAIPGVGDIADFLFKSNLKNLELLEMFVAENPVEDGEIVG